jgi:glycosyltransferase involved in cell wall biosynthesis
MNILYMSCHSILEYDELSLFEELGLPYFSLGSYVTPTNPVDPIRPALKYRPDPAIYEKPIPYREALTAEFVDRFDTIIAMHVPDFITKNWDGIKNKRVIWRSIGQSTPETEAKLASYRAKGLEVIRYSPREAVIENNIGADALIRFYKNELEFCNWVGGGNEVVTFAQNMMMRGEYLHVETYRKMVEGFNAKVYGPNNKDMGELDGGLMTYDQMKQKMRDCRVYIYTGTQPASYTLSFIEAMMTGCPMVCLGPKHAGSLKIAGDVYEIPDIITDGMNGFCSDDVTYLRACIERLTHNVKLARIISQKGRETAINLFGKQFIKKQWEKYLCQK